jgi:hypothetical protein
METINQCIGNIQGKYKFDKELEVTEISTIFSYLNKEKYTKKQMVEYVNKDLGKYAMKCVEEKKAAIIFNILKRRIHFYEVFVYIVDVVVKKTKDEKMTDTKKNETLVEELLRAVGMSPNWLNKNIVKQSVTINFVALQHNTQLLQTLIAENCKENGKGELQCADKASIGSRSRSSSLRRSLSAADSSYSSYKSARSRSSSRSSSNNSYKTAPSISNAPRPKKKKTVRKRITSVLKGTRKALSKLLPKKKT